MAELSNSPWDFALDNGIRFVMDNTQSHLKYMAAAMYIRTGSLYETPKISGISHMVEHMMFRGTPKYETYKDFAKAIESCGGIINAWTGIDEVSYHVTAPKESELEVYDLLLEMFRGPRLEGFDRERETVLEEVRADYLATGENSDPEDIVRRLAFSGPLGYKIAGTEESVSSLRLSDLRKHINTFYRARNMALVVTGGWDKISYGDTDFIPPGTLSRTRTVAAPKWRASKVEFVFDPGAPQTSVVLGFRAPGSRDKDYYAYRVLSLILNGGMSTRVEQSIRESGLAYDAGMEYETMASSGLFTLNAVTSHDKARDLTTAMLRLLAKITSVTKEELHLAKKQALWGIDASQDSAMALLDQLGTLAISGESVDLEVRREGVRAVTKASIEAAAKRLLSKHCLYGAYVGNVSEKDQRFIRRAMADFDSGRYPK